MAIYFTVGEGLGQALFEWWQGLEKDRASRAVLRRASSLTEISLTPAYQRLCGRLGALNWKDWERDRFALVVGVLAHVKTHDVRPPALAMSQRAPGEDRPPVSELRFLRLLESPDPDSLFSGVRRVLPLMGGVDVIVLANDLIHWGDAVKKKWAYGYDWPEKTVR
ncbi:MAG: CRISPR-associated Cse2 family protein [Candidatus Accumulibacter regalis]|jgi:CRISPR system Cascade subunit CasB|uniref:CRISPR-associated Cse2 family protein n=1 Tax=Accumulibacter regalis TaxID=522306 RepID=A0A011RGN0_ACCRE|nr:MULTISPECIES: type I-E CRISPR-associated protein Cse2/CasB [unclassified Candidatus Accumulibacter]EXI90374.1 MAG: CRISPR-associated Cse2 family protein [Candidatus Accumulibacter regalis]HRE72497.1 type I-E CRISPR-associated protein Cse2/CasB [Accumulibacter sp.]